MATKGLEYLTTIVFSSDSAQTVDNLFTTTYDHYLLAISGIGVNVGLRFRSGGSTLSTSVYSRVGVVGNGSSFARSGSFSQSYLAISFDPQFGAFVQIDFPATAVPTTGYQWAHYNPTDPRNLFQQLIYDGTDIVDGVYIFDSTTTTPMTGDIDVYGMRK